MMRVWDRLDAWQDRRRALSGSIGFVPTMGALHRGHASLVERCRRENDIVVVSIFVNPTQFNDPKDLERYPRTLEHDLALLRDGGVDEVFAPTASEMYPGGYRLRIVDAATPEMESAFRPGFLDGVRTIVLKLLNLVRADRAYFGEKDYQQLEAIKDMVREFSIPTEIVPCPTVREASGLAESSRNTLLSGTSRRKAAAIYRILSSAPGAAEARHLLETEGFTVDYIEERWGRRLAAVFLDGIRLIDNVAIPQTQVEERCA
ncbi:MAG TPA: pantoate--beta-alanine ligase [Verrucomicrobiae bacterium]|nr:pantoate--beta-alanine ligase [Verrucomicrobiae bacterium]